MSGADAFMLSNETPRAYMHTFKVAILDPSTDPEGWSYAKYSQDIADRIHLIPFLRWKLAPSPLGISHPMWVDDPDFNLGYHMRRVSCPSPGDHKALCEFMSSVYAYQLDRSRPLWISWIVEGLEDGKVAAVTMIHHAYVDGVGAAWSMQQLYRTVPGWRPDSVPPWQPRPWPSWGKRLWWGARDLPRVLIKHLPRVVSGISKKRALDRRLTKEGKPPHPTPRMMQQTPINEALSYGRTFVCDSMPLDKFKAASKGLGVTINDVFLCCSAGAVRRLLLDRQYDPNQHPLIAVTPFSGPRPEGWQGMGNFVTADYCWLHCEIEDPLERLRASHEAAAQMKQHLKASVAAGADVSALLQVSPPWLINAIRWYVNSKKGRISMFGNLALSNVPGPREPLYINRYKLDRWFSTGQVFDGTSLNMTMWSYCDSVSLCIVADQKAVPDGWALFNYFVKELDTLADLIPPQQAEHKASAL
jgi:WS/DGAT/MGAT family acyltransferase